MLTVGESLGKRHTVVRAPEHMRAGATLELSEQGGAVALAQVLADGPVDPGVIPRVRPALAAIPASRVLLRPKEVVFTRESVPLAVYDRAGLVPLVRRLPDLAAQQGPRRLVTWLIQCVAVIARDLGRVHDADAAHGAITLDMLLCQGSGPVDMAVLSGFGIGPIRVNGDPSKRSSPRQDLVDLISALHELFSRAGAAPEGGLAAKWMVLRHSSMHGEHPALASGATFAEALQDLARIPVGDDSVPPRGARTPSVAPSKAPPAGASKTPTNPPSAAPGAAPDGAPAGATARRKMTPGTVVAASLGGLLVLGLGYLAFRLNRDLFFNTPSHGARAAPRRGVVCRGEQTEHIEGPSSDQPVQQYEAVCAAGGSRMLVVARSGASLVVAGRAALRGQSWVPASSPAGARPVELGNGFARPDAEWIAWRNSVGAPLALARFDGHDAHTVDVALPGWEGQRLQGAHLLHVGERAAFVVTSVVGESGARAMLLEVAIAASDRPPVIVWSLANGAVDAVIPGERPTVLVHGRLGPRHTAAAVAVDLAGISQLSVPPTPLAPLGNALPEAQLQRSPELALEGAAVVFAPLGATATDGARGFAATAGDLTAGPECVSSPAGCVSAGAVMAVVFPQAGTPSSVPVAQRAWAEDIQMQDSGGYYVLAAMASETGAATRHKLFDMAASTALPTPTPMTLMGYGSHNARVLGCGADAWMIFDAPSGQGATVSALPVGCLRVQ